MKILHVIDSLTRNGRTTLLYEVVRRLHSPVEHLVVTLSSTGPLANRFSEIGGEVLALRAYSPVSGFRDKKKVVSKIFNFQPDVCLCWSGDANLFSTIPRLFGVPVVWTLHNSTVRWSTLKTRYGIRVTALLSHLVPAKIVCCSNRTYDVYQNVHRYKEDKLLVIANGVDVARFQPSQNDRERIRNQLGISESALVVATSARMELPGSRYLHGDFKDLETLFKAAAIVSQEKKDTQYLLFGSNIDEANEQLVGWVKSYGLQDNVKLLGFQENVAELYAAADVFALSSAAGEGLPVSLIEAMASGAIPVCTDSGDIGSAVGSAGIVVPQKDATKLAAAILHIARLDLEQRHACSRIATEIVRERYNIEQVAGRYRAILIQAAEGVAAGSLRT